MEMTSYEAGTFCTGPVCGHCREVHKKCGGSCAEKCECPEPILDIDMVPNTEATYRLNDNGKLVEWNLKPGIYNAQTDTSLTIDRLKRVINFMAERHIDSISANDLGSILHLTDLGDVTTKNADDGAMLVFKKNSNCSAGCVGDNNIWQPWNALDIDNQVSSVAYGYGFDKDGKPATLQQPANTDQYYNLGWDGENQLSLSQLNYESASVLDSDGYDYVVHMHPKTKRLYYTKVKP